MVDTPRTPEPQSAPDLAASLEQIHAAAERIAPFAIRTPVVPSPAFSERTGRDVWLKVETLQRTGAFKVRGALNKILGLDDAQKRAGVIAASAGNHAQGVGFAAKVTEVSATIVMPEATPIIKVERTKSYGANVELFGENYEAAFEHAVELARETGATMVHPFDDMDVIHGQGTIGLELAADIERLDTVVVPIGGGGLIAGIALALRALVPDVRIVGVQAAGAAPMADSFHAGAERSIPNPRTLADGIQVGRPGKTTWPLVRDLVDDVVTVSEDSITDAIASSIEDSKLVLEGAGAAGLAALLDGSLGVGKLGAEGRVAVVLCGGNIDLNLIARVIESGLAKRGRYHALRVRTRDVPGTLLAMTNVLTKHQTNILDITHHRQGWRVPVGFVEVEVLLETRSEEVGRNVERDLAELDFEIL